VNPWYFAPLPLFSFDFVEIVPACNFDVYSATGAEKSPQTHYATMSLADIASMPMGDMLTPGGVWVTWTTPPLVASIKTSRARFPSDLSPLFGQIEPPRLGENSSKQFERKIIEILCILLFKRCVGAIVPVLMNALRQRLEVERKSAVGEQPWQTKAQITAYLFVQSRLLFNGKQLPSPYVKTTAKHGACRAPTPNLQASRRLVECSLNIGGEMEGGCALSPLLKRSPASNLNRSCNGVTALKTRLVITINLGSNYHAKAIAVPTLARQLIGVLPVIIFLYHAMTKYIKSTLFRKAPRTSCDYRGHARISQLKMSHSLTLPPLPPVVERYLHA